MEHTAEKLSRYERVRTVAVYWVRHLQLVLGEEARPQYLEVGRVAHGWCAVGQRGSSKGKCTLHTAERMESMNFILWLIIGGILGWIASLIMGTDEQ